MKKLLALCAGMMLIASAAMAQQGLHMSWVNCPNIAGNTSDQVFSCDPLEGAVYFLNGTFSLAASTPGVVAMDGIIDWLFPDTPTEVPPFWQFQSGGCNESGLVLVDGKPAAGCGTLTQNTNLMCGTGGGACDGVITAYGLGSQVPALGAPNRARLLITLARSSANPVTLGANVAPNAHFAFQLNFFQDNVVGGGLGECVGCGDQALSTWNQAVFYNTAAVAGEEGIAANLSSSDPGSANASVSSNCDGTCQGVDTKAKTWGQLKSLYR